MLITILWDNVGVFSWKLSKMPSIPQWNIGYVSNEASVEGINPGTHMAVQYSHLDRGWVRPTTLDGIHMNIEDLLAE